jgi:hypothetical protein
MVRRRREDLPRLTEAPALLEGLSASWAGWAGGADIPAGTPYLISPRFTYDVDLNRFFYSADMLRARDTTRLGYARDLSAFLTFLFRNRGGRDWRDATESDHTAYLTWRRRDADGPRVSGSTWDRELSAVNRFYKWQVRQGRVAGNPIPQLERRSAPVDAGGYRRSAGNDSQTPAAVATRCGGSRPPLTFAGATRGYGDVWWMAESTHRSGVGGLPGTQRSPT